MHIKGSWPQEILSLIFQMIGLQLILSETHAFTSYRKDRNFHGGGVMLLINKELLHMPLKDDRHEPHGYIPSYTIINQLVPQKKIF